MLVVKYFSKLFTVATTFMRLVIFAISFIPSDDHEGHMLPFMIVRQAKVEPLFCSLQTKAYRRIPG